MLVATYALLTLMLEQKCERTSIRQVQERLVQPADARHFDRAGLALRAEQLILFAESRHQLRLETSLLPALREAAADAGTALRTLDDLGRAGRKMLPRIRAVLRPTALPGRRQIALACRTLQAYCQNLIDRLACEEQVLLPLAQRVLPSDAWFKMGAQFLLQDADREASAHSA